MVRNTVGHTDVEMADAARADAIIAKIAANAPDLGALSEASDRAGKPVPELISLLRSIGVFRMTTPNVCGGFELALPQLCRVLQALARIDGSLGWTGVTGSAPGLFLPRLPPALFDEVLADGPDVLMTGVMAPGGTAEEVANGWRVRGRWAFASNCQNADWLAANCIVVRDGEPVAGPAPGVPETRFVVLPAHAWQIENTWDAAGLRGTGSHHVALPATVVARDNVLDMARSKPIVPGQLYADPYKSIAILHDPIALGLAEGAFGDIIALARSGRRQLFASSPLLESETFQYELGRVSAKLRAAQGAFATDVAQSWNRAGGETSGDGLPFGESGQLAVWIAAECLDIVERCFSLGGGASVFCASPLQRRLRDMQVAAQHAIVHPRQYVLGGRWALAA